MGSSGHAGAASCFAQKLVADICRALWMLLRASCCFFARFISGVSFSWLLIVVFVYMCVWGGGGGDFFLGGGVVLLFFASFSYLFSLTKPFFHCLLTVLYLRASHFSHYWKKEEDCLIVILSFIGTDTTCITLTV